MACKINIIINGLLECHGYEYYIEDESEDILKADEELEWNMKWNLNQKMKLILNKKMNLYLNQKMKWNLNQKMKWNLNRKMKYQSI